MSEASTEGRSAFEAACVGLGQIREHVYRNDREWNDVELVVDDVITEVNELIAGGIVIDVGPAPGATVNGVPLDGHPSRKSDIESGAAAELRDLLEG